MDDLFLARRIPAAVAEHGVDPDLSALLPDVDPAGPAHGDFGMVGELVPAERVGGIDQRPRGVRCSCSPP